MEQNKAPKVSAKSKKILKPKIKDYKEFTLKRTENLQKISKQLKKKVILSEQ